MEAIAFVVALAALAALSLRFGQDSLPSIRSKEQEFAAVGGTWDDLGEDQAKARTVPTGMPAPAEVPRPYPTLAFIEQALGDSNRVLTESADADRLEVRARELVAEFWSERAWTTGLVPESAFRRVLAELAPTLLDVCDLALVRSAAGSDPIVASQADMPSPRVSVAAASVQEARPDLTAAIAPA